MVNSYRNSGGTVDGMADRVQRRHILSNRRSHSAAAVVVVFVCGNNS